MEGRFGHPYFINFIYGQLKEREAQNEALHSKLEAQMERFDRLQASLDVISSQLAESNKMKEVLQKGFDNMQAQLIVMKDELVKTQKELRQPNPTPTLIQPQLKRKALYQRPMMRGSLRQNATSGR